MTIPCAASMPSFTLPLRALGDEEGSRVPRGLPFIVDAHVHAFAPRLFEAIWRWFDTHGWPIRYRLHASEVLDFLLSRGVGHLVLLHYAHKPGIARSMNAFMAECARGRDRVTALATVFPGEEGAKDILEEAFVLGLRGVKLHCHVQGMAVDDSALHDVYDTCVARDLPLVIHAGREPKSAGYKVDPYTICGAERMAEVLRSFPKLRVCVPHLGADEFSAYETLLETFDNLWLDSTMMLGHYLHFPVPRRLLDARPERIFYGTDFPNLPYAWDRELVHLGDHGLTDARLPGFLGENATRFFRIALPGACAVIPSEP